MTKTRTWVIFGAMQTIATAAIIVCFVLVFVNWESIVRHFWKLVTLGLLLWAASVIYVVLVWLFARIVKTAGRKRDI
jgi:hypothetical protein